MAIATLAAVYNNPNVFTSVVKIRKGLSCKVDPLFTFALAIAQSHQMMVETNDIGTVHDYYRTFAESIARRIPHDDPSANRCVASVWAGVNLLGQLRVGSGPSSSHNKSWT